MMKMKLKGKYAMVENLTTLKTQRYWMNDHLILMFSRCFDVRRPDRLLLRIPEI